MSLSDMGENKFGSESYFWHKLHSLTGIFPVGFYLAQHLMLNTFSLAGPEAYDGVIGFFEGMPRHIGMFLKIGLIWVPLLFHMVYGIFITSRGEGNYSKAAYKYRENAYYTFQRVSGILAAIFILFHVPTTSIRSMMYGPEATITYANWQGILMDGPFGVPYLGLAIYVLGIAACTYHLSYGLWNFSIRWGLAISPKAQASVGKLSAGVFVVLTLFGWAALGGFLLEDSPLKGHKLGEDHGPISVETPAETHPVTNQTI
jgi:succinate dehydrogenase / fumarate reductase cytochrome b subunit